MLLSGRLFKASPMASGERILIEILNFLKSEGYLVSNVIPDGKLRRFKLDESDTKQSGWYVAFQNELRGTPDVFYVLEAGDWRTGKKVSFNNLTEQTTENRKIIKEQISKATRLRETETKIENEKAAKECEEKWNSLALTGDSPYLTRKKLDSYQLEVRYDNFNKDAYVPIKDTEGKIWSLQKLPRDGGFKPFHTGSRIAGNFFSFGTLPNDSGVRKRIFFAEGFATAASIFVSTGECTVCVFSSTNLSRVSLQFRKLYPDSRIFICGDDDLPKEQYDGTSHSSGRIAADKAANGCIGTALFPRFKNRGPKDKDWNDLLISEGIDAVRNQLENLPERQITEAEIIGGCYPDENDAGKRLGTMKNIRELLRRKEIQVRYNVISKREEISIPYLATTIDNRGNANLAHIIDWCERCRIPIGNLGAYITAIADQNPFNPVATWIESEPWDGYSRLPEFYDTITASDTPMKERLMRAWLISAIAAAYEPNGVSAHGVLVLQGDQYMGKTKWFKNLAPAELEVLTDGAILHPDDKDSVFQVISNWIVELGELDATFRKSDISQLKAFITKQQDVIRRPYAKTESNYARRTVFFASVNESTFLNDPTGNRRFWTIECQKIDYNHSVNMQQLWAEALALYRAGESWYLTGDEILELNSHNEKFQTIEPVEELVMNYCDWEKETRTMPMTATELCRTIGIENPNQKDIRIAAATVRKLTGQKPKKGKKYNIPYPKSQ